MKKLKTFISCVIIAATLAGCYNYNRNHNDMSPKLSQKHQWMKEYALCKCITEVSRDTLLKNDLTFSVYANIADYGDSKIYRAIDSAAKHTALNIQPSQIKDYNGKKAYMLSCIQFSQSKKLDSLIKSYDSK